MSNIHLKRLCLELKVFCLHVGVYLYMYGTVVGEISCVYEIIGLKNAIVRVWVQE